MRREVSAVIFDMERDMFLLVKLVPPYHHFWRLLKGGIEDGETDEEALYRELWEEVGLKKCFKYKDLLHYQFTMYGMSHDVNTYLVLINGEAVTLNRRELMAYTFVNRRKLTQLLHFRGELEAANKAVDVVKDSKGLKVLYDGKNRGTVPMHGLR